MDGTTEISEIIKQYGMPFNSHQSLESLTLSF